MLLFAYASNMDATEFAKTVPSARKVGNAKLAGYRFGFSLASDDGSTKASLIPSDGLDEHTWGVLIRFNDDELDNFFFKDEWFEWKMVSCADEAGHIHKARTFVTLPHAVNEFTLPYDWYHAKIIKIATDQDLPAEYVNAIKLMPFKTDPNEQRRQRRLKRLS